MHPDRVADGDKEEATEKFKVLTKIHGVLTDPSKKALYDEQGVIDDDDGDLSNSAWLEMWRQFFKPITTADIDNYYKEYQGNFIEDLSTAPDSHTHSMFYSIQDLRLKNVTSSKLIWVAKDALTT